MSDASEPDSSKKPNNRDAEALVPTPESPQEMSATPTEEKVLAEEIIAHAETRRREGDTRERFEFEEEPEPEKPTRLPFDPWRLADALVRSWYLCLIAGILCAGAAFYWYTSKNHTQASMQLVRRDPPIMVRASDAGEAFKPQEFKDQTLMNLVRTPELFRRVGASVKPPVPLGRLAASLSATPERDSELVTLLYKGPLPPASAVTLLNAFANEIVRYTQEMQVREGQEVVRTLGEKLSAVETNLAQVQEEMQRIPPELRFTDPDKQTEAYLVQLSDLDMKYELARIDMEVNNPAAEKLQAARDELAALLVRYTEAHPLVQDAQARVNALEKQMAASTNSAAGGSNRFQLVSAPNSKARLATQQLEEIKALRQKIQDKLKGLSEKSISYALIKNRYQTLESIRLMLQSRQREAELYTQNALGYYQVLHAASLDQASNKLNWRKFGILLLAAALMGICGTAGLVLVFELLNSKIKTVGDLECITGIPVLAAVGDLSRMSEAEQDLWAFRTWTILRGKISHVKNHALVCGMISAQHGEGRTTWIKLLAKTAHQRGLRVLVAATRPSPDPPLHPHEHCDKKEAVMKIPVAQSIVTFPFQAAQQLNDPKSHAIVHIPLPGWVWNLERREQWQSALAEWTKINNLVFLVELPPASEPESILLAENLPQLIWLADSGKAGMMETRTHLETLRQAGCNLVGAVLNHEPRSFLKKHLSRWIGTTVLVLALGLSARAQQMQDPVGVLVVDTNTPPVSETNLPAPGTLSAPFLPKERPAWQKHLTLGPGDVITLAFYGETNWTKTDVVIGMDGRVNYLQANNILATGLTVDQLRDALNSELAKYYRAPRAMVTPVVYRSKKYYVMGRVITKGAFVLDRPISIVEAVSRARGLETAISDRNAVDLADLQRSFLLRQGKRVPVDFERLFQQGDFSQNVSLEPEDFLYFAPATLKEVYVLGEVRLPGIAPISDDATVMRVIVDRGGFTDEAYKQRIIVVRGSLSKPEVFTVNSWAILDAREADFKLKPRDIIYVSKRPFIRGEELADIAVTSFLQSATTSWVGDNIGPIITTPFVPSL